MKKIIAFIVTMAFVLTGCGSSNKLEDVYGDMDAKETYEAMIEYMDEEVTYYREESVNLFQETADIEYFINEDGVVMFISNVYDEDNKLLFSRIRDGENVYTFSEEDFYAVSEIEKEERKSIIEPALIMNEDVTILDAKREDTKDGIVLTFKVTWSEAEDDYYSMYKFIIDSEGYLASTEKIDYTDEDFTDIQHDNTYKVKDINKKDSIDTEMAIKKLEDYVENN
jgi:hypothetical protein